MVFGVDIIDNKLFINYGCFYGKYNYNDLNIKETNLSTLPLTCIYCFMLK